jgi:hypothetical protein
MEKKSFDFKSFMIFYIKKILVSLFISKNQRLIGFFLLGDAVKSHFLYLFKRLNLCFLRIREKKIKIYL